MGSKVREDPQEFIDKVYTIVHAMGVTSRKKAKLALFKMKYVAQVWYTQCKGNKTVESGPIEWEELKETFVGRLFPRERTEVKVENFINLKQET